MPTSRSLAKQVVDAYASTLFEAAHAAGNVDVVGAELADVASTVRAHHALRDVLLETTYGPDRRAAVAREVFASMDASLVEVLGVMAERGDFDLLGSVRERYAQIAEAKRDMVAVEVTTVVELTDALREKIRTKLAADLGKQVVLQERIDPSIIGGVVISAHGKRLDASIASQLEAARATLSTAPTGGEA